MFLEVIAISAGALGGLGLATYLLTRKKNYKKLSSFKTRYESEVWTPEQMEFALQAFVVSWCSAYPEQEARVRRALNKLTINWVPYKWVEENQKTYGALETSRELKLWHGPQLPGERYKMGFTVLPELLIQYVMYEMHDQVLSPKTITTNYRNIILDHRSKLNTQIGKVK